LGVARSLYIASRRRHVPVMRAEFELRRRHGFDVQWLEPDETGERYGITPPGAILSALGAHVDPYRITWRLFGRLQRTGTRVFDRTSVASLSATSRSVTARTVDGITIRAGHVVLATGYANQRWLRQRV